MTRLSTLSTTDAADIDASIALVPTGSTEQHGPALPLGTDSIVAADLAEAGADHPSAVLGPTVPVGVSPHHRHFTGTLWASEETFRQYVEEIARSFAHHDIRRIVFVNGHGGNVGALTRIGQRLRAEETAFAATWNWWDATSDLAADLWDAPGGHAGHGETSMMYAVDDDLVHADRLEAAENGAPPGWGKSIHGANVGFDTIDFTPTGAVGHPTDASEDAGSRLRTQALSELEAVLDWLDEQSMDELFEHAVAVHPRD